ncbi:low temperature requirement A protein (LtrA) [Micromonospora carbonacea]|uniref:Low temperature requirement A protein (LtrA) n=1 Tax=Micromonospora carbonacea TaxID=47853 RepID=A0A1C4XEG3_9ACTN|nr:low temperature requirement A protein (LtrA) [Micromonospora carbonacea]
MRSGGWSLGVRPGAPGSRTTRLEFFYDLVFVYAFLNVTTLTVYDPSPVNLCRCLLVLGLLARRAPVSRAAPVACRPGGQATDRRGDGSTE